MENNNLETFRAQATGTGWPTHVEISETEWKLQLDEPEEDGGSNSGANPMQYFIAALAGCQNEQAQVVAEELGLSINQIFIEVEVDLDLSGFMGEASHSNDGYKHVRLKHKVDGEANEEQIKNLGEKVDARCPILGLLRNSNATIDSSWSKR